MKEEKKMPKFKWERTIYYDLKNMNGLSIILTKLSDVTKDLKGGKLVIKNIVGNKQKDIVYYEAIPDFKQAQKLFIMIEEYLKENIKIMQSKYWTVFRESMVKYMLKHRN